MFLLTACVMMVAVWGGGAQSQLLPESTSATTSTTPPTDVDVMGEVQPRGALLAPLAAPGPAPGAAPGAATLPSAGGIATSAAVALPTALTGYTFTQGLPTTSEGRAIFASVLTPLPATGGSTVDIPDDVVAASQIQASLSDTIPDNIELALGAAPAPAPAPGVLPFSGPQRNRKLLQVSGASSFPAGQARLITQNRLAPFPEGLQYRFLSPFEYSLFAEGSGPLVEDVLQNRLGDCWLQATLMSVLESGDSINIRDVDGSFQSFVVVLRIRKFLVTVVTDNSVLFDGVNPWSNSARQDPRTKQRVAWPLIWTKAYAIAASRFEEIVSPGIVGDTTPNTTGWFNLVGGNAWHAMFPVIGRVGAIHTMQGTIAAKIAGSSTYDSKYFDKLFSRQKNLEVMSTLSDNSTIIDHPNYNSLRRSIDVGGYTVQIVDELSRYYSVRWRATGQTFVVPFGHAYSLTFNSAQPKYVNLGNPWGKNAIIDEFGQISVNTDRYIRGVNFWCLQFAFRALHYA